MNALLLIALGVFGAAFVFAAVITMWRNRLADTGPHDAGVNLVDRPFVTLIVPVRNGEATIAAVLQDLYVQTWPKARMEVVVVDDASTDRTEAIVRGMQRTWSALLYERAIGEGKKAAITTGVGRARGELILMTDADARCGAERVERFAVEWMRTGADMLMGPVRTVGNGFFGGLQEDEQAALTGVAAATALGGNALLASGANMAFSAKAFAAVGGYHGDRYASGDDIFLLERMKRDGRKVAYVLRADALVTVEAEPTFTGFRDQRIRWAGKMRGVAGAGKWVAFLALLFPWLLLAVTIGVPWTAAANHGLARAALLIAGAWALWIIPVVGLAVDMKRFMGMPARRFRTLLSLLGFTCYAPLIAMASLFVRPRWRGRSIR